MLPLDPHAICTMIDIGLAVIALLAALCIFCLDLEPVAQLVSISAVVAFVSAIHFAMQVLPGVAPALIASQ